MVQFYADDGPTLEARNKQLLEAARTDDLDLLFEVFDTEDYDINFQDG